MISSAQLLSNFERCPRAGYWSRDWYKHRLAPMSMVHIAVRESLVADLPDPGDNAGSVIMTLAADRGLDVPASINLHRCAINHACAADLIVTALRRDESRWRVPESGPHWQTSAFLSPDGKYLRRFLAVTNWSEDREFYEKHSWFCLGEVAQYEHPMQLVVAVLGPMVSGRRTGYFSKALLHPQRSELRFRLRRRAKVEGFRETWIQVLREEHDEISREKWLESMAADEVFEKSLFVVEVPVPDGSRLQRIRDLADRQLERLEAITTLPEKQLTTCHNPIHPCPFRGCCWSDPESEPKDGGYDRVALSTLLRDKADLVADGLRQL